MICIKCQKQTPDEELYCRHCGVKLDMTFDQIRDKLGQDIHDERVKETELFFRWILIIAFFAMIIGWFFNKIWEMPLNTTSTPAYIPQVEIPMEWQELQHPIIISK